MLTLNNTTRHPTLHYTTLHYILHAILLQYIILTIKIINANTFQYMSKSMFKKLIDN